MEEMKKENVLSFLLNTGFFLQAQLPSLILVSLNNTF